MEETQPCDCSGTPRRVKKYRCKYCDRTAIRYFYVTNKSTCIRCISVVHKLQRGKEETIEEENREIAAKIKSILGENLIKKRTLTPKTKPKIIEEKEPPIKEEPKEDRIKTLEEKVTSLEEKIDTLTKLLQEINTKLTKEPSPSPKKEKEPSLKEEKKLPSPKKPPTKKIALKKKSLPKSALAEEEEEEEETKTPPKRKVSSVMTDEEKELLIVEQARKNIKKGIKTYAKLHEKYLQTKPPSPLPPRFKNPYMAVDAYTRLLRKYKIEL